MSCRIDIGQDAPCQLTVTLVAGAPFTSRALTRSDDTAWPHSPELTFAGGVTWVAALTDDDRAATFTATVAEVGQVGRRATVALHDPVTGHVYGVGTVTIVPGVPA